MIRIKFNEEFCLLKPGYYVYIDGWNKITGTTMDIFDSPIIILQNIIKTHYNINLYSIRALKLWPIYIPENEEELMIAALSC